MLRIEIEREFAGETTLRLFGAVDSASLPALRDSAAAERRSGGRLVLDLDGVTAIDRAALRFLVRLARDGAEIARAPGFVREWLRAELRSGRGVPLALVLVGAAVCAATVAYGFVRINPAAPSERAPIERETRP